MCQVTTRLPGIVIFQPVAAISREERSVMSRSYSAKSNGQAPDLPAHLNWRSENGQWEGGGEDEESDEESVPLVITKLERQKKDPNRVSVFINGSFAFGIPSDIVVKFFLRKGMTLDRELRKAVMAESQLMRAKSVALEYLSGQPRTEHQVFEKLRKKGYDEATCEKVIARFRELRYLDDALYARMFVKSRMRSKGHGPRRMRGDLRKKGVDGDLITLAIEELESEYDLQQEVLPIAMRRWTKLAKEPSPFKRKKKWMDFMVRQGFNWGFSSQLLETIKRETVDEEQEEDVEAVEEVKELDDFVDVAEKQWRRLSGESDRHKRKRKFSDALRRRSVPYPFIETFWEQFLAEEVADLEALAEEEAEGYEEEPMCEEERLAAEMEEWLPIAQRRWEKLGKSESNTWKRKKKLSDFLRRKGVAYDVIEVLQEHLE
jgi:regulatory protein